MEWTRQIIEELRWRTNLPESTLIPFPKEPVIQYPIFALQAEDELFVTNSRKILMNALKSRSFSSSVLSSAGFGGEKTM